MLDGGGFLDGLLVFLGRVNATEDLDPSRRDFFALLDVATSSNGMPHRLGVIPLLPLLVTKSALHERLTIYACVPDDLVCTPNEFWEPVCKLVSAIFTADAQDLPLLGFFGGFFVKQVAIFSGKRSVNFGVKGERHFQFPAVCILGGL